MVGPRVYHLKHARSYPAFTAEDPSKVMDLAVKWLTRHDFRVKRKTKQYSRGSKRGIHVNFVPKFKLFIEQGTNGQYVVRFDYYAKIKIGTAVVAGVLTWGITTVVGVGTLAVTLADADHFVDKFWAHIDSLARGNPVILTVERWASDGKGNFVKQPSPAAPVAVAAVPGPQVNPSLVKQQSQSGSAHVVSQLPQPTHMAYPPHMSQPAQSLSHSQGVHHVSAQGQHLGPPEQRYQPPPGELYYPSLPPPVPQQVTPPRIEPGQVFGHHALRQTQSIQPSAPPITPMYPHAAHPPSLGATGYPNPTPPHGTSLQHAYPQPQQGYPQSQQNYPTSQGMPHMANNSYPPPLPPKPSSNGTNHPLGSQHDHPTQRILKSNNPPMANSNYPAPHPSSRDLPAPPGPNSQYSHHPSSHSSSLHSNNPPPFAPSQGYPSPPSARNSYHPSAPQTSSYPPPPTPQATLYPPAPSVAGSGVGFNDAASRKSDDVTQNRRPTRTPSGRVGSQASFFEDAANRQTNPGDKPLYKGDQLANNVSRMSLHDKSDTSSLRDFNYTDKQSLKQSGETFNPWDSNVLAVTRKEALAPRSGALYPPLGSSGLPSR